MIISGLESSLMAYWDRGTSPRQFMLSCLFAHMPRWPLTVISSVSPISMGTDDLSMAASTALRHCDTPSQTDMFVLAARVFSWSRS